jgi:hypothetical protein
VDNHDLYRRVELKTAVTSGKKRVDLQDSQEDPRAGIREESNRDVQRVAEGERLNTVEVLVSSRETKQGLDTGGVKPLQNEREAGNRGGASYVEAPTSPARVRE